jgi:hypothetical protein
VEAEAEQRRLLLDRARRAQDVFSPPGSSQRSRTSCPRSFDPEKGFERQPGVLKLGREFIRVVEVCGREPLDSVGGVAVLSLPQVALDDRVERGIP